MDAEPHSELIRRLRRGDEQAAMRLVQAHEGAIYRLAMRMLGDAHRAQDVCQETFLRTFGRLSRLDGRRPLLSYLRKVATNLCLTELRRRRTVLPLEAAGAAAAKPAKPELDARAARLRDAVDAALADLPDAQRAAFVLFHQEQLDYRQIAELTGRPMGTVKSDLFRARRQVGEALRDGGWV
jgi:RNA polymerase sigma-70 factor (ECF subfamily)